MPFEARDTLRLQLAGKIDQWFAKTDGSGAVFLMNVTDPAEAHALLEVLPLGRPEVIRSLIPMGPLGPWVCCSANRLNNAPAPPGLEARQRYRLSVSLLFDRYSVMSKKVLVAGANGDTGRAAVELIALDLDVRAMVHKKDARSEPLEKLASKSLSVTFWRSTLSGRR